MASSSTPIVPSDARSAVNFLLRSVGLSPISSLLTADLNTDALQAKTALDDASRMHQTRAGGWAYNTEKVTLTADAEGKVALPANCLSVRTTGYDLSKQLVKRGGWLYDPVNGTGYNVGGPVKVIMVTLLDYADLPEAARMAITGEAMKSYGVGRQPSPSMKALADEWAERGITAAEQEDAFMENVTLADVNPHFIRHRRR